jgi:hypothetical protein
MTETKKLEAIEIRSIADKYLIREREPALRTAEPLPGDYEAFKDEFSGDSNDAAVRTFEEEWADLYDQQSA